MPRPRNTLAPTLFPFLAVLVCTLGTLMLMLALVAADAQGNVDAKVTAAAADAAVDGRVTAASIRREIDEADFRAEMLRGQTDAQDRELQDRRERMRHLRDHIAALRDRMETIRDEVRVAASEPKDASEIVAVESELADLEKKIEGQKALVADLQQRSAGSRRPRIILTPHAGPNGTTRRPVYLECDARGVTFRPSDINVPPDKIVPGAGVNVITDALDVVRRHAAKFYGDTAAPYPLIVVRPDGVETYSRLREALADWDDHFGYELVPTDVDLAFPDADAGLKTKLTRTVAASTAAHVAPRGGGSGGSGAFDGFGSPPASGRLTAAGTPAGRRPRGFSASELRRRNAARGFGSRDDVRFTREDVRRMQRGRRPAAAPPPTGDGPTPEMTDAMAEFIRGEDAAGDFRTASDATPAGGRPAGSEDQTDDAGRPSSPAPDGPGGDQAAGVATTSAEATDDLRDRIDDPATAAPSITISNVDAPAGRGANWAVSRFFRGGGDNVVVRRIAATVTAESIAVAGTRRLPPRRYDLTTDPAAAIDDLVLDVNRRVASWGPAVAGGQWSPELALRIEPGGGPAAAAIWRYLRGSGLSVVDGRVAADPRGTTR